MRQHETILLIHSAGNTGAQWDGIASELHREFHLVTPDLYDCGRGPAWPHARPMTFDDEAELLAPLLHRPGAPVHLVGHSFGGGVALRLVAALPEHVASLTLIEPAAYQVLREVRREDLWSEFVEVKERFQAPARRGDMEAAWQPFFDYYCDHAGPWHELSDGVRAAILAKTRAQLQVYEAQETNPTRLADIRRLPCPTLVIHGEHTTAPERGVCEVIARHAPECRSVVIEGAGHMAPLTHPAPVAVALRSHAMQARHARVDS